MTSTNTKPGIITTSRGGYLSFADPMPGQFDIRDIARGLSCTCRFAAQCRCFICVAQHSLLVAHMVAADFRMEALMHDRTEAYMGDMPQPLKYLPEMVGYRAVEHRMMARSGRRFDLPATKSGPVAHADREAMRWEAWQWKRPRPSWSCKPPKWAMAHPHIRRLLTVALTPKEAEREFLKAYTSLASRWGRRSYQWHDPLST